MNQRTSHKTHNTPLDYLRRPHANMVNWGDDQNKELIRCIERGDIDPHNTDGDYLFGKTVQLFKGFKGDRTQKSRSNVIARLRKKLKTYCFDGTLHGRQKQAAAGDLFTSHSLFLPALSIPILIFSPCPCFGVGYQRRGQRQQQQPLRPSRGGHQNAGRRSLCHKEGEHCKEAPRLVLVLAGAVCYIFICFWYTSTVS